MSWSAARAVSMASFGETLKRERELREISLRQISEATKINIRYLEALEGNRFESLPGGLFNKGFIRAYATFIGIDGEAMVNTYLQEMNAGPKGIDASSALGAPNLHRPAEVPHRRASRSSGMDRGAASPISLVASPRGVTDDRGSATTPPSRPERAPQAVRTELATTAANPLHGAVSRIEDAAQGTPGPSRVLAWVLSLVAVAGLLFLIVTLARRPGAATPRPPEPTPAEGPGAPGAPPGEVASPSSEGEPPAADAASAVLPEVSSQSPLTLSAIGASAPKAPPTAARTRSEEKGAAGSAASPTRTTPPPAPERTTGETAPSRGGVPPTGPMELEVEARHQTYAVLVCDGREVLNRNMGEGETVRARCDSVIRISATDAAAVSLAVNGFACLPLGDPGTRAFGYTIRIDDYARICPASGRGVDGRP